MPFCPDCGKEVSEGVTFCPKCGQRLKEGFTPEERQKYIDELKASVEAAKQEKQAKQVEKQEEKVGKQKGAKKIIKEIQCTCSVCGHIWFYTRQEALESASNAMINFGKLGTFGLLGAIIPDQKVINLGKCPKCGSKAIKKEKVVHEI